MAADANAPSSLDAREFEIAVDPDRGRKQVGGVLSNVVKYGLLLVYMVICLYPFVWMVVTSLRDQRSVFTAGSCMSANQRRSSRQRGPSVKHRSSSSRSVLKSIVSIYHHRGGSRESSA